MDKLEQISKPLETIIDFAWAAGADKFWVNNAKDELKKLRQEIEKFNKVFNKPSAWTRINDRGDLFDIRLQPNPYIDKLYPLYLKYDIS